MELVNETKVVAGWTMGFQLDGREVVIVAIKATFALPRDGGPLELAREQAPLVEADVFTGEPGLSAPLYESDYAHSRPFCDVLLNGSAHAPVGTKVQRLGVGLRVGQMVKTLVAIGNRVWRRGVFGIRPSEPEPFEVMPISYDNAFGGVDRSTTDPNKVSTFLANPVGRGYSYHTDGIDGQSMPNTEELNTPISDPRGTYRPMSFGAVGRNWPSRLRYAGTYDQRWLNERAPFWPDDFDYRYFQSAPHDQQIPHPTGGEPVVLKGLTPEGSLSFQLPALAMPILFIPYEGEDRLVDAVVDTIVIEPDRERLMLTWRAVLPMRRSCFDIRQVIAGEMAAESHRRRRFGNKPYYKGLSELVRAKRRTR